MKTMQHTFHTISNYAVMSPAHRRFLATIIQDLTVLADKERTAEDILGIDVTSTPSVADRLEEALSVLSDVLEKCQDSARIR